MDAYGRRFFMCAMKCVNGGGILGKIVGGVLILAGAIVLLACVPNWFWTMLLGIVLIASGFFIWRFWG